MTIHSDGTQRDSNRPTTARDGPVRLRSISRDEIQHVLDNDRRRAVVRCLLETDEPVMVRTLVAQLADTENDTTVVTTVLELRQRIHVSLRQTHLPLLESLGVITYDRACGIVSPGANLDAIEAVLQRTSRPGPLSA